MITFNGRSVKLKIKMQFYAIHLSGIYNKTNPFIYLLHQRFRVVKY